MNCKDKLYIWSKELVINRKGKDRRFWYFSFIFLMIGEICDFIRVFSFYISNQTFRIDRMLSAINCCRSSIFLLEDSTLENDIFCTAELLNKGLILDKLKAEVWRLSKSHVEWNGLITFFFY